MAKEMKELFQACGIEISKVCRSTRHAGALEADLAG